MSIENCIECGGKIILDRVPYDYKGLRLGWYEAEVCKDCGETYFSEQSMKLIEKRAKVLGIWGKGK